MRFNQGYDDQNLIVRSKKRLDAFAKPGEMKLPRPLLYSLLIFDLLLTVWLLEPMTHYYFIPIEEKMTIDGSRIDTVKVITHWGASAWIKRP